MKITTVGIDLAKSVLQIHAIDESGKTVSKKQFKRDRPDGSAANSDRERGAARLLVNSPN